MKRYVPLKYILGMIVLFFIIPSTLIYVLIYFVGLNKLTISICILLVFFVIFKIVKDREASNDLVQETFFTMHNKIDQYSGVGNFKYWLLQIAKNKAKNYVKKIVKEKGTKVFVGYQNRFHQPMLHH